VSNNDEVTSQALYNKIVLGRKRSGFSAEMKRREEKVQKWRAVADCSRHEQRQLGRLDRRR